ncbi:MAG TPA: hypothetical protein VJT50_16450 [Pyrinomonadaceae bacterium]|nr:hypothetical protein [Pyrinomonadaceae bacterium]
MKLFLGSLILLCAIDMTMAQTKTTTPQPSTTPNPAMTPMPAHTPAPAQTPTPGNAAAAATPTANPADVASVDSIIAAVYDVISGPAGKKRDWDRMKSLFIPGARLIPTGPRQTGGYGSRVLTVDEYAERAGGFFDKEGFYEREVSRKTEQFGQIVHAFSTYESRHAPDEKPFQRGINSIQLMNDGTRWWVVTIFWQGEDEKHPLPEKYLTKP